MAKWKALDAEGQVINKVDGKIQSPVLLPILTGKPTATRSLNRRKLLKMLNKGKKMKFEEALTAMREKKKAFRISYEDASSFYLKGNAIVYEDFNGDEDPLEIDSFEGLSSEDILAEDWEVRPC